jgi:hypothetical protein
MRQALDHDPSLVFYIAPELMDWRIFVAMLLGIWAFLPGSLLWRRGVVDAANQWIYLDPPAEAATPLQRFTSGLPRTLLIGLVGGLLCTASLLVIRLLLLGNLPEAVRSSDDYRVAFFYGQILLALFWQLLVAVVVTAVAKHPREIHGLLAAFISGCLAVVGIVGLNLAFGGIFDLEYAATIFNVSLINGALMALPVAAGVSALASLILRLVQVTTRIAVLPPESAASPS